LELSLIAKFLLYFTHFIGFYLFGFKNKLTYVRSHKKNGSNQFEKVNNVEDITQVFYCIVLSAPAQCGGPLVGTSGNFASPNYPGNYPNNAYCIWTITVPQGLQFRIDFLFFETEPW